MARKFDEKQKVVLENKSANQLVSAGAGSGKTTVMIQKIIDIILTGELKPQELVVLTFTNQAGNEMKQKLLKSLNERLSLTEDEDEFKRINLLREEIDMSSIDTIDGFCSKMIKKYFYKLNLTPDINIATGIAGDYYLQKAIDKTIEEAEKENANEIESLADCFEKNARNLDSLKENIINVFNFVMVQKDCSSFLEFSRNEYKGEYASANFLNNYIVSICQQSLKDMMYNIEDISKAKAVYDAIKETIKLVGGITKEQGVFENAKRLTLLPSIRFNPAKDEYAYSYKIIKTAFQKIKSLRDDFEFLTRYPVDWAKNTQHIEAFLNLVEKYIDIYQEIKAKNKVMDFTDLERNMLKLLSFEDVKNEIYSQFKYIFVDEYQDINPMQDAIIEGLKSVNTKMFFVGDVKQSIYGFRQSTPEMFLEKYKTYKDSEDSDSFDMNINFRTAPSILNFNNELFSQLMTEDRTDINYVRDAKFEPKRDDIPVSNEDVEIAIFNSSKEVKEPARGIYSVEKASESMQRANCSNECLFIIDKIKNLVGREFYDSQKREMRKMKYSDITILSRSINDNECKVLIESLKNNNIPIAVSNKIALSDAESIKLVASILKLVANQCDDVSVMAYLMSNLAGFTLEEVYEIVLNTTSESLIERLYEYQKSNGSLNVKVNYALNLLEEIRINASVMDNLELINAIMNKYGLKYYILTTKNGENEINSIENFLSNLTENERSMPLEEFISYLELNLLGKTDYSQLDDTDAVAIQTIHASKGLEYPVVILFNASKKFRPNNYQEDINFDNDLGIGMPYFDLTKRIKWDSIPKYAIKLKNKIKCYKEELRLFYVAVTRPQNKLIITGKINFADLTKGNISEDNYLNLIYSVFQNRVDLSLEKNEFKNCVLYFYDNYQQITTNDIHKDTVSLSINGKNLNFVYPYARLTNISLKNNVTAISKELNEDYNMMPENLHLKENLNARHDSSRELGTVYHQIFSNFDLTTNDFEMSTIEGVDNKLIEMAFHKLKTIASGTIRQLHESPFLMYLPYNEIYLDSDIEDKILVQGVIDLILEFNDKIILIDYKLSNLSSIKLKEKYATQLRLYKLAIEKAYNKKVEASYIYNIITGEII